jgi:hypothetical protein
LLAYRVILMRRVVEGRASPDGIGQSVYALT